jgi:Mg/Co/Ni transporter MgtE
VGVIVPLVLRRLKIDPALSAWVILTTLRTASGLTLLGLGVLFLTLSLESLRNDRM